MIQVKKLVKRFGPITVLRELDFEVRSGEFVALLGPNGAGKTTLLRILSSLSKPTSGMVKVANFLLPEGAASVRALLGVVSHLPLLYGDLSAEENLSFFARLYGVEQSRIGEVLDLVGLSSRKSDLVRIFSRGMQQRLAIGRSILHNPRILLLDEPHTGLDQDAGEILDNVLREIALEGRTVVMTSHDLVRAAELSTRMDILSKGKIKASTETSGLGSAELVSIYRQALQEEGGAV
ncbi:MAG: heme ABC exporter ATP-binding protein CcmA [Anaerolineales bacterium]|nr:heme ABC exporter ATP-binding protein CcmA [Anaerolineales bacterium]